MLKKWSQVATGFWVKWEGNSDLPILTEQEEEGGFNLFLLLSFGDGIGDLCSDKDQKRLGESGLGAGEPWPGEEPVRAGVGPDQEEEHPLQRAHPDREAELQTVAVRGAEPTGLRRRQVRLKEEDERWVEESPFTHSSSLLHYLHQKSQQD